MKPGPEHVGRAFRCWEKRKGETKTMVAHLVSVDASGVMLAVPGAVFRIGLGDFDREWDILPLGDRPDEPPSTPALLAHLLAAGFDQVEFGAMLTKETGIVWRFRGVRGGNWVAYDHMGDEPNLERIEEVAMEKLRARMDEEKAG